MTRLRKEWLVIYAPAGAFVARADSPAGREARRLDFWRSTFRTLEGAYDRLRADRAGRRGR